MLGTPHLHVSDNGAVHKKCLIPFHPAKSDHMKLPPAIGADVACVCGVMVACLLCAASAGCDSVHQELVT